MATETEVQIIKYEGDITNLQNSLKAASSGFTTLEGNAVKSTNNVKTAVSGLGNTVKSVLSNLPIQGFVDDLNETANAAKEAALGVTEIGGAAKESATGVELLGEALSVGVLGALVLIIGAFASVVAFLNKTDQGAEQLKATLSGAGAAIDIITGKLAETGSGIVDFFTKADEEGGKSVGIFESISATISDLLPAVDELGELTGVTGLLNEMIAAADQAYAFSLAISQVENAMRNLSVQTKETQEQVAALLKDSRNNGTAVSDRLNLVNDALALQNSNLGINFVLEKKYYDLITQENFALLAKQNGDKQAQLAQVRTIIGQIKTATTAAEILDLYKQQQSAQIGLLRISDDLNQKQADGAIKLIELEGQTNVNEEKFANIKSNLIQKDISDQIASIESVQNVRQTDALNNIASDKALAAKTLQIQIDSLLAQRKVYEDSRALEISQTSTTLNNEVELYNKYGQSIAQVDLQIATLRRKYADEKTKEDKASADAAAKNASDDVQRYNALINAENALDLQRANFTAKDIQNRINSESTSNDEKIALVGQLVAAQDAATEKARDKELANGNLLGDQRVAINEKYDQQIIQNHADAQAQIDSINNSSNEKQKQQLQALSDFTKKTLQTASNELFNDAQANIQNDLNASEAATQKKIALLQQQQQAGTIDTAKYNAAVQRLNDQQAAKERDARIKQAQADKDQALFNIFLNTAIAFTKAVAESPETFGMPFSGFALASGALEAALVIARPLPTYKDGVIDIQGAGTTTSDSITARLSKGESVMTAKETSQNKDLLWSIRNNRLNDHINRAWVLPALDRLDGQRKHKEDFRDKALRRLNKQMDLNHLERLTARNGSVNINNVDQIAAALSRRQKYRDIK